MNTMNREAATVRVRSRAGAGRSGKGRTLLLSLAAAVGIYVLLEVKMIERLLPVEWFREVAPVTGLHPVVAEKRDRLVAQSKALGIDVVITDDFRSTEEQNALYRQGRGDKGAIVTQVKGGGSYHNYGLAIDFALRIPGGDVIWDLKYDGNGNGKSDWMEVVSIAKKLGFSWGGDWKSFPDYPHLQMDFGYSIGELQRGWRPPLQPE